MRILVRIRPRKIDERGATAILVACLSIVLVGLAGFTVDFGQAYVGKRQLQTAADAAALAAASVYADKSGTCDQLTDTSSATANSYRAEAESTGQKLLDQNRPGNMNASVDIDCKGGQLIARVSADFQTPSTFSAIFGASGFTTQRAAEATLSPASGGVGVRPYAICSVDTPSGGPFPTSVVKVGGPGQAHTSTECPGADNGGNWWFIDCPEDATGDPNTIANNVENGCDDPISIVPGQPNPASPSVLSDYLTGACPSANVPSSCLSGDTGNSSLKNHIVYDKWDPLLGKTIVIPVFCGDPTCDPAAVESNGGTKSLYPIHKLAAVTVCGFHFYDAHENVSTTGACAGNTLSVAGGKDEVFFLLKYTHILISGDTKTNGCELGTECDGGVRQVQLTK